MLILEQIEFRLTVANRQPKFKNSDVKLFTFTSVKAADD
jgi:hypothetical protein